MFFSRGNLGKHQARATAMCISENKANSFFNPLIFVSMQVYTEICYTR